MSKRKITQKSDPTLGDVSQGAAAGGQGMNFRTQFIPYTTPGGESRQQEGVSTLAVTGAQFLEPPEDPNEMFKVYQLSSYLAPIMDALDTNVYKAPFKLKSVIPFDRPDEAKTVVRDALLWDKMKAASSFDFSNPPEVSDEEVEETIELLKKRSVLEKHYLERFFQECVPDMTYRQLSALTGQDYEITGNAYWEVIRDTAGRISRLSWLPSLSMRATRQDNDRIPCSKLVRDGLRWAPTAQLRRFRKYAQLTQGGETYEVHAWFKEFGDPRVMSRRTGQYYTTVEEMQAAEGDPRSSVIILPATEVLHFKLLFGGSSVYGKPRWAGSYVALRGSRDLDEENQKIVGDEAIPSLLLMISGGIIAQKAFDRLKSQIEERKKGRKGILLAEAIAAGKGPVTPSQHPTVEAIKLKSEQQTDMLFQKYDIRNEAKADAAWRLPKTVLGKAGANRAIAQAERQFAEDQVFTSLRADKDEPINTYILSDLDITTWTYETQSMQPRDPQQRAEILRVLVEAGIITPNEGRELASPIFAQRLNDLQGLWTMFPPRVLTVLLQTKNAELAAALLGEDKSALANLTNAMRDNLGLGPDGGAAQDIDDVPNEGDSDGQKVKEGSTENPKEE